MTRKSKPTTQTGQVSAHKENTDRTSYLTSLIENLSEALIFTDMEIKILEWNAAAERMYGWTADEVLGHPLRDFIQSEYENITGADAARIVMEEGIWKGEVGQRRKDGTLFPVLASVSLVRDEVGKPVGFLAVNRDMTKQKQREKVLRESEITLQAWLDAIQESALLIDREGIVLAINAALGSRMQRPVAEIVGKSIFDFLPAEVAERRRQYVAETIRLGKPTHFEDQRFGRTLDNFIYPVFDQDGQIRKLAILATDITDRKQTEREIAWLASFPERNPNPIIEIDASGTVFYMNPAAQNKFPDIKAQGFNHPWLAGLESVISQFQRGEIRELQREVQLGDTWYSQPIYFVPEAQRLRVYGAEITERKRAEESLRDVQNRMSGIVESAMDAIISVDNNQQILLANPASELMFGYGPGEMIGKPLASLLPEQFRAVHVEQIRQFGATGLTTRSMDSPGAIYGLRSSGEEFPAEASISQMTVGTDKMYTVILRDVTERKQAEARIQRQLKHLSALRMIDIAISSSFDLNIILDVVLQQVISQLHVDACAISLFDGHLQKLEYAASRGFRSNNLHQAQLKLGEGYASQAVLKRKTIHISALLETSGRLVQSLPLVNEEFVDYYGAPLIVKGEVKGVLEIYHRSHLKVDAEWLEFLDALAGQAAIAIDNAQLFEGLQRSNFNLERRVAERTAELNRINAELERANRVKDEFLANMSHELRTPLTSILGLSESLLEQRRSSLDEYQQRSLQIIESSGQHLLELINDILDLSKIEAGKFDFYPQPIVVDEICKSSLSFVRSQAAKKSITIAYRPDTSISKIFADPRRLKQILVNLLSNAVKFTAERGEVKLEVDADLEQDLIKFSVVDNGIGIAPENLRWLFQPFMQVDSGLDREHEGTGLGLALVQKLADLHGGSVELESEVGKGSRFTVSLPCLQEEVAKLERLESPSGLTTREPIESRMVPPETPTYQGRILLADDNLPSVLTISEYLETYGYEMVIAHDGSEAVEKAETIRPDLILMDIQMPVMNGLDAIASLRRNPRFADTPIIALTALAMPGDRERSLQAGANEYMSKPVSLRSLAKTIEAMLRKQE